MNNIFDHKEFRSLAWSLVALIVMGSLFLTVKTLNEFKSNYYIGRDVSAQNTIVVQGNGEVSSKPDIATFSFSVTDEEKTVASAQNKVADKINKALVSLKAGGVAEADIKTSGYNIYPKYDYYNNTAPCIASSVCPPSKDVLRGYEVSENIDVKVRDVAKAGDLLSSIGNINVSSVSSLIFSIDKEDDLKAAARKQAIDKAKNKAQKLAGDLGVSLGRVISFSENTGGIMPMYSNRVSFGATPMTAKVSVPTGENKITSDVSITYEIR